MAAVKSLMRLILLVPLAVSLRAETAGTALVQHAPTLNGSVEGSIRQMTAENVALNSGANVAGSLFVPGTPAIQLNGRPVYGGTVEGAGAVGPANYKITLNSGAALQHVVRRSDAIALPVVKAPSAPSGTRSVALNRPNQSAGDFATLRNLTLNSNAGSIAVPPGNYGDFTANSGSGFRLGVVGATLPATYNFQNLTLNSNSTLTVVGPVVITLGGNLAANAALGEPLHPEWLTLKLAGGSLSLNCEKSVYAYLEAPAGTLTLNSGGRFVGAVTVGRLVVNSNAVLKLVARPDGNPPFTDNDHDGMDDAWELAHGLNPSIDDGNLDYDGDGVSNLMEFRLGLQPNNNDSDGDGLYDGDEIALGRDPAVASPDRLPPTAPTGLGKGVVTADSVSLSWQPSTDDLKVSGYVVYRDGQPVETAQPIRGTTFTDTNLPDGEEFTYQVRAFDFAGNLSPLSAELVVATVAADADGDGLPDEWEQKYFGEEDALPNADSDGDGRTNLQEFQAGTNPKDFFDGVKPTLENLYNGQAGPNEELAMIVHRPDGRPWPGAPINFTVDKGQRRISIARGGPGYFYQLQVRADANGRAQVYLEPLQP